MIDVSVIIVNYNTKCLLMRCLDSIYKYTVDISFEVIVSDNGSTDDSYEDIKKQYSNLLFIENRSNLGFGMANNVARKKASGKYIFYLNSDTILLNNAIKYFYDYWEDSQDKSIGSLGSNLLDENQNIIHSYACFPNITNEIKNKIRAILGYNIKKILHFLKIEYKSDSQDYKSSYYSGEVDYITGADLFIKNNELADFDDLFFMYYEDVYLAYNIKKHNLRNVIIDGPKIIHLIHKSDSSLKKEEYHTCYSSFSSVMSDISRIKYFKLINENRMLVRILMFVTKISWMNRHCKKTLSLINNTLGISL